MRTRNKPALIFFCLLLSAAAVLSGVKIYSELREQQKEKEDFEAVVKIAELAMSEAPTESVTDAETGPSAEPTERNIQALIAANADCIGWLSIDGTNISYPVMHTPEEPQKYLRRSFYGEYSQSGVPFLDGRCSTDGGNLIVYGHNMKNGTMFASLVKYQDQEYYEKHPVMYLYTPGQRMKLEILAGYTTDIEDSVYTIPTTKEGRDELVKHVLQKSNFTSKASVTGEDKLVTLSTCTYEYEDARFVVIGKIAE